MSISLVRLVCPPARLVQALSRGLSSIVEMESFETERTVRRPSQVAHLTVEEVSASASSVVSSVCPPGCDPHGLIRLGAVYRAPVGRPTADAQRILHDVPVYNGEYMRVHVRPRRYDVDSVPWEKLVVHHEDDFIVINKPAGVPTVPTGDNYYENVIVTMQRLLGARELFPTQRLDTDTTGLLVIGKSQEFASHFGRMLRQGEVKKTYKALLAAAAIPHGLLRTDTPLVHYTPKDVTIRPRVFTADPSQYAESRLCEMSILSKRDIGHGTLDEWLDRLGIPPEGLEGDMGRKRKLHRALEHYFNGGGHRALSFAELELDLVTGRTHQIRGQLSAVGRDDGGGLAHVAGDNMYQGMSSVDEPDRFKSSPYLALQASAISFRLRGNLYDITLPNPWWYKLSKLEKFREGRPQQ